MAYLPPALYGPNVNKFTAGDFGGDGFPLNASSNQLASSLVIKAGHGSLFGCQVLNTKASAQFILFFDAAAVPPNGTVPVCPFTVAASSNLPIFWGVYLGRSFSQGIVVCNSSTAATLTLGAADCFFDAQYI